jgi:shikimate kinase
LLRTSDPTATLRELYDARVPFYEKADLTVRSDGQASIETMVDRVLEALKERPDVLEWTK